MGGAAAPSAHSARAALVAGAALAAGAALIAGLTNHQTDKQEQPAGGAAAGTPAPSAAGADEGLEQGGRSAQSTPEHEDGQSEDSQSEDNQSEDDQSEDDQSEDNQSEDSV